LELEKKMNIPSIKAFELKPLEKETKLEQTIASGNSGNEYPAVDSPSTRYHWNASDTDLLELTTALLKSQTIVRQDGRKITQKELKEVFEKLFEREIKGAKNKLATAVNRKKSVTSFLDSLVDAFETYSREGMINKE